MQPYQAGPPPPRPTGGTAATVLLVVGGVVLALVVVIGILAALAISGMRKFMAAAKTAEALNGVGMLSADATAAYERERLDARGAPITHRLCPSASRAVPPSLADVRGKKYASSPADWSADAPTEAGFACLRFQLDAPQYYQYQYRASGTGAKAGDAYTAEAHGDLDGDGAASTFSVTGTVGASGAIDASPLAETRPEE